jgi:hypothetical protein
VHLLEIWTDLVGTIHVHDIAALRCVFYEGEERVGRCARRSPQHLELQGETELQETELLLGILHIRMCVLGSHAFIPCQTAPGPRSASACPPFRFFEKPAQV